MNCLHYMRHEVGFTWGEVDDFFPHPDDGEPYLAQRPDYSHPAYTWQAKRVPPINAETLIEDDEVDESVSIRRWAEERAKARPIFLQFSRQQEPEVGLPRIFWPDSNFPDRPRQPKSKGAHQVIVRTNTFWLVLYYETHDEAEVHDLVTLNRRRSDLESIDVVLNGSTVTRIIGDTCYVIDPNRLSKGRRL
jgi:hypothetical protein